MFDFAGTICANICSHSSILLSLISQALALLGDYIDKEDSSVRIGAIMGLGISYAGSQNDQVLVIFFPILLLECFGCSQNFNTYTVSTDSKQIVPDTE